MNGGKASSHLKVSTKGGKIEFILDQSAAPAQVYLQLKHPGGEHEKNRIVFKMKVTHRYLYLVKPNIGILNPNESMTVVVTLVEQERRRLLHKIRNKRQCNKILAEETNGRKMLIRTIAVPFGYKIGNKEANDAAPNNSAYEELAQAIHDLEQTEPLLHQKMFLSHSVSSKVLFSFGVSRPNAHEILANFRQQNGQCGKCGIQTHAIKQPKGFFAVFGRPEIIPLSIPGEVHRGRCLFCHPLPPDAIRITSSMVAATAVPINDVSIDFETLPTAATAIAFPLPHDDTVGTRASASADYNNNDDDAFFDTNQWISTRNSGN